MKTRLSRAPLLVLACLTIGFPVRAQVPNAATSYYYPQSGPVGAPTEGAAAAAYFRACPNNDGGSSLPLNARIKVVLNNADGPIVGLSESRIYLRFNGGTPVQDYTGDGADSIIANGVMNSDPPCPLVEYVYADGPTDGAGETYITFTGAGGVRDPDRKWGHYDSELPVFANGVRLQGRLTPAGINGDYVLRIKNFDFRGGLANGNNQGEVVSSLDYNSMSGSLNLPPDDLSYWRDLDSSGATTFVDLNMLVFHKFHDCGSPIP